MSYIKEGALLIGTPYLASFILFVLAVSFGNEFMFNLASFLLMLVLPVYAVIVLAIIYFVKKNKNK